MKFTLATKSVNLGEFRLQNLRDQNASFVKDGDEVRLVEGTNIGGSGYDLPDTMLLPGKSWSTISVQDAYNGTGRKHAVSTHSPGLAARADRQWSYYDWSAGDDRYREWRVEPELGHYGFDSVDANDGFVFGRRP